MAGAGYAACEIFTAPSYRSVPAMRATLGAPVTVNDPVTADEVEAPAPEPNTAVARYECAPPVIRGALARAGEGAGAPQRWVLDLRSGAEVRRLVDRGDLPELARRGPSTPDHVIRIKAGPAVLPAAGGEGWREGVDAALQLAEGALVELQDLGHDSPRRRRVVCPRGRRSALSGTRPGKQSGNDGEDVAG